MKNCEALQGCKKKARYMVVDHKLNRTINACEAHFKQGMKAWLEKDPILRHLMHQGII